jgi:ACS family hexuronate transporter-like MFS transporter
MSYLDRQALSIAAPVIRREMRLDNAQLGLLLSAFFYSYAFGHLVVGWILDRFPMRATYGVFVALWSLSQAFSGLSRGFGSLLGARVALGGFESAAQPGAARIIAAIVPERDRSLANGIMMSGGSLGAIIAPPLMIFLTGSIGWRYSFTMLGGVGSLWTLAWLAWFRPPASAVRATGKGRELTTQDQWSTILRSPRFWACVAGGAFATPIIHISSSWIPTYFVQQWNLPMDAGLGIYLLIIYAGLDLGFLTGGAATTLLTRTGMPVGRSRKIVMTISTVCMLAAVAVPIAPTPKWAVLFVFLLNFGRASYGANYLAFNQEIAPNRVGMMAGIMGSIGAFSGALLVGVIGVISKTAGFRIPFFMVGALAVLGLLPILFVSWDHSEYGKPLVRPVRLEEV